MFSEAMAKVRAGRRIRVTGEGGGIRVRVK